MTGDLEKITRDYWALVQRIRRLPMAPAARAMMLNDVRVIYLPGREGRRDQLPPGSQWGGDTSDDTTGKQKGACDAQTPIF